MNQVIYITEPDVINIALIKKLLPTGYEIIQGNTSFEDELPSDCSILVIRSATTIDSSIKEKIPKLKHIIRVGTGTERRISIC